MPRILKNIRIDEVSACIKGAGEGAKIVLMKRDTSADDDDVYQTDWYTEQAAIAERQNEEHVRKHAPTWRSFNEVLAERTAKSFAATARGDEADRRDEETSVDELGDGGDGDSVADGNGNEHPAHRVADLLIEAGQFSDRAKALEYLLTNPRGAAMLQRLSKSSEESVTMSTTPEEKLSDLVKRAGITAVAAQIVKADSAFSIDEHQLTALTIEHAKREHPQLTDAQAFAQVYSAQDEGGVILRKAFSIARNATLQTDVDDSAEAMRELQAIGKRDYPGRSSHQQFAKAFEANPELARRAHRRPSAGSTSFPYPKF